jgi:methylmalonyl-CoA mutase N-terminal domain/subunit
VVNVADPLGGSWYVESLTDRLEAEAEQIFGRIKAMSPDSSMTGGILRGIEEGWFMAEIAESAFAYQQEVEKGDKRVVGVNCYPETVGLPVEILRVSHEVERVQARELAARRQDRDQAAVDAALGAMLAAARSGANMLPGMLDAARAEATLVEIGDALRAEWGTYFEVPPSDGAAVW